MNHSSASHVPVADIAPERVPLLERTRFQCAFALESDGGEAMCCGRRVREVNGRLRPYCNEHDAGMTRGWGARLDENYYASLGNRRAAPLRLDRTAEL